MKGFERARECVRVSLYTCVSVCVCLCVTFSNTEKLFTDIFGICPPASWTKTNIHLICTTNRSKIKDLGKSNLTRCMTSMGNKVPNSMLKSVCVIHVCERKCV